MGLAFWLMSTDCDEINFDIYIGANSPILVALGSNFIDRSEVEINFCLFQASILIFIQSPFSLLKRSSAFFLL